MIDYEGQQYQADMQATIIKLNGKSFFQYIIHIFFFSVLVLCTQVNMMFVMLL